MKTQIRSLLMLVCAATASLLIMRSPAQAGYMVTLEQVGSNVVATGSGPIDLTGLTFVLTTRAFSAISPGGGDIVTGTFAAFVDQYTGFSGPTNFGSGPLSFGSGSGDLVGIFGFGGGLLVPKGYVSDTALSDSATYDSATFSNLGVTPGTYVWSWGTGPNQNFTLKIGTATVPDHGSTVGLLLLGLAALITVSRLRLGRLA